MKRRGRILSLLVLIVVTTIVFRAEALFSSSPYRQAESIVFNQNNDFENRARLLQSKEGYWVADRTELMYIDKMGKILWVKPMMSQNIDISSSDNIMVITEKKAGDIFLLDSDGNIHAQLMALGEIDRIKIFYDQYVGVLLKNKVLMLFDHHLSPIGSTVLPQGDILDYQLSLDLQNIVVTILDFEHKIFNSKLVFINQNGNIKSGTNLNEAIIYDVILTKQDVITLTDMGIYRFAYNGKLIESMEIDANIMQFAYREKTQQLYVQLFRDGVDFMNPKVEHEVRVYDQSLKTIHSFEPPMTSVKGIVPLGNTFIFYNDFEWAIVDENGKLVDKNQSLDYIHHIHVVSERSFGIEYVNRLDVYTKK